MNISDLVLLVAPRVLGCPQPSVELALVLAAQQLCLRARVWVRPAVSTVLPAGGTVVPFGVAVPDAAVSGVFEPVLVDGERVSVGPVGGPGAAWVGARSLVLAAPRATPATITADLALSPLSGATELPDDVFGPYQTAIMGYALWQLCLMDGQSWTNAPLAQLGLQDFERGVEAARIEVNQTLRAVRHVRTRPFN